LQLLLLLIRISLLFYLDRDIVFTLKKVLVSIINRQLVCVLELILELRLLIVLIRIHLLLLTLKLLLIDRLKHY
jgi:hypothetical protein